MNELNEFIKDLLETEEITSWLKDINTAWNNWVLKQEKDGFTLLGANSEYKSNILKPCFEALNCNLSDFDLGSLSLRGVMSCSVNKTESEHLVWLFENSSENIILGLYYSDSYELGDGFRLFTVTRSTNNSIQKDILNSKLSINYSMQSVSPLIWSRLCSKEIWLYLV